MKQVWIFDENRRVYERDENGRARGGCLYSSKWVESKIIEETSRSYVLKHSFWIGGKSINKIPKKDKPYWALFTKEAVEHDIWVEENRRRISDRVNRLRDYDLLRKISDLLEKPTKQG